MTPAARIAAAIDLLADVFRGTAPADALARDWFARRRYAGGGDRRAIRARVWDVLRRRGALAWHVAEAGGDAGATRALVLADLVLADGLAAPDVAALFTGAGYGAAPLDPDEEGLLAALAGRPLDDPAMPDAARLNVPDWLLPLLDHVFGPAREAEMAALAGTAPVDLRVNSLKTSREAAQAALAESGVAAQPTPWSPLGLRLDVPTPLDTTAAFRDGLVEVQDEGSQLLALAAAAQPGETVIDLCAGAGGKALALAAAMGNEGRILACDVSAARLQRMVPRLRRAGAGIVEARPGDARALLAEGAAPADLADLVFVDAPCSGSGVWRRAPEDRWRLTQERLDALVADQTAILAAAAALVRPGGRLVYATCSLLAAENADIVDAFLATGPGFRRGDARAALPVRPGGDGPDLVLTPHRHGTDGVYAALLLRD